MAKAKTTIFFCQNCGYESSKWLGQCPGCKEWNTMVEEIIDKKAVNKSGKVIERENCNPTPISEVHSSNAERTSTGMKELDRVLGGGIVTGSMVLIGGDPGIGKSTLLLQMCRNLSVAFAKEGKENDSFKKKILYVSGEESAQQIKMRADRIGGFEDTLELLSETNLGLIRSLIENRKPSIVMIDSIQTMYLEDVASAPGSVSQVREATGVLMQIAKQLGITVFVVGHVTKDGTVAGPRMLEHMVDTVLYFEGEKSESYRILRGVKNRFGSTNEIGVFEMRSEGLREVENPSEYMLSGRPQEASGSVVTCSMEGTRPILLEIQALVCHSFFNNPRRTATGVDLNRMNLLMAVLEKRVHMTMSDCDAYVNIAGGMRMSEPGADLGIVLALMSSRKDIVIPQNVICFGEVGLSGEVRGVSMTEQRVMEAKKLGFTKCILPAVSMKALKGAKVDGMELIGVSNVSEAYDVIVH